MSIERMARAYHYAAQKHSGQTRKGAGAEPYVNHVIDVANRVAAASLADEETVIAALLHDIVEDTDGSRDEIAALFGERVAALVMEVSDDKSLHYTLRKQLQIDKAPSKSDGAKRIKLADKASNLTALSIDPPVTWDHQRRTVYVEWAESVVAGCRGIDSNLETAFDVAARAARTSLRMAT